MSEYRTMAEEFFEMGRSAGSAEYQILEGEKEYVAAEKARLREMQLVLGVARWCVERDVVNRATVVTFSIFDWDLRGTESVHELIERAASTVKAVARE